jgi:DNA-binding IclR family transcriptional regulator
MSGEVNGHGGAPAVERAVKILEYLANVQPEATLADISTTLALNKSTCFNILKSLQRSGVVVRDTRVPLYRLGPRLVELGTASRRNYSYRVVVTRELKPLVDTFKVTCLIAQLLPENGGMVVTDRILSPVPGALSAPVGQVHPLSVPAMGRAVLAARPFAAVVGIMHLLPVGKEDELTELSRQLEQVRARGFALSLEEYQEGVNAVATTVLDPDGDVALILCLMGSSESFPTESVLLAGAQLRDRAKHLELLLQESLSGNRYTASGTHAEFRSGTVMVPGT